MDPEELVRKMFVEVYGEGRTDLVDELYADDFVMHGALSGDVRKQDVACDVRMYRRAIPDLALEVVDVFACRTGERRHDVAMRWHCRGTHTGDLVSLPATGRCISVDGMTIVRVEDGRAREAWLQLDGLALLLQLGLLQLGLMPAREAIAGTAARPRSIAPPH